MSIDPTTISGEHAPEFKHFVREWIVVVLTGAAALVAFAMVGEKVFAHESTRFDGAVQAWSLAHRSPLLDTIFLWITTIGGITGMRVLALLGAAYLWFRGHRRVAATDRARDPAHRGAVDGEVREVDEPEPDLGGQRRDELGLGEDALLDEHSPEGPTDPLLLLVGGLELGRADEPAFQQDVAQLLHAPSLHEPKLSLLTIGSGGQFLKQFTSGRAPLPAPRSSGTAGCPAARRSRTRR